MYLNLLSIPAIVLSTIAVYFCFLVAAYSEYWIAKKTKEAKGFVKSFYYFLGGAITSISYIVILQFQFYLFAEFIFIINIFLLMHFAFLLKIIPLLINLIFFTLINYFLNSGSDNEIYALLIAAWFAVGITLILKWFLKKHIYLLLFISITFLIITLSTYFIFNPVGSYYIWVINTFTSFGSLIFLNFVGTYAYNFLDRSEILRHKKLYENNLFYNPTYSLEELKKYIVKQKANYGVFFCFDINARGLNVNSNFIETNSCYRIKSFLNLKNCIYLMTPNSAYSVFIPIFKTNSLEINAEIQLIKTKIQHIMNHLNRFYEKTKIDFQFKSFVCVLGRDCFDYQEMVQIGELGIYNSDFATNKIIKEINFHEFQTDLETSKLKKELSSFLEDKKYFLELKEINRQLFQQVYFISDVIFGWNEIFEMLPKKYHDIFLRIIGWKTLKMYSQQKIYKKKLNLLYPIKPLIQNPAQFPQILRKIESLKIDINNINFIWYNSETMEAKEKKKADFWASTLKISSSWYS